MATAVSYLPTPCSLFLLTPITPIKILSAPRFSCRRVCVRRHEISANNTLRVRNKLFTSATEAFRRGQGMSARDLARRGRELNLKMKEKHREAAEAIFGARNPGDQVRCYRIAQNCFGCNGSRFSWAISLFIVLACE